MRSRSRDRASSQRAVLAGDRPHGPARHALREVSADVRPLRWRWPCRASAQRAGTQRHLQMLRSAAKEMIGERLGGAFDLHLLCGIDARDVETVAQGLM